MPATYEAPTVDNWDELQRRLDQILAQGGRGKATQAAYASALLWWETFCHDLRVDPFDAPFDAWEAAVQKGRRNDGRRLGWDYYSLILRAVDDEHKRTSRTPPAPKRPQNASAWAAIGTSYRARLNQEWSGDRETYDRTPLFREDLAALLRVAITDMPVGSLADHAGRDGGVRRAAERLVLLDTRCSANLLARTTSAQVSLSTARVEMVVGDQLLTLPHDHLNAVRGVPHDCAACAVERRSVDVAPGEPLFNRRAVIEVADGRWPGLLRSSSRLIERPDLTARDRAGLRRGLLLSAHRPKEWIWWLLGRAWVSVAWEAGFRMSGDLADLDRSWCSPLPAGDGFRIQLAGTKEDQEGSKRVTMRFPPDRRGIDNEDRDAREAEEVRPGVP